MTTEEALEAADRILKTSKGTTSGTWWGKGQAVGEIAQVAWSEEMGKFVAFVNGDGGENQAWQNAAFIGAARDVGVDLAEKYKTLVEERHTAYSVLATIASWTHDLNRTGDGQLLRVAKYLYMKKFDCSSEEAEAFIDTLRACSR